MEKNILKQILFDEHQHWEAFKKKYGASAGVLKTV
jgi:hypothetical protein